METYMKKYNPAQASRFRGFSFLKAKIACEHMHKYWNTGTELNFQGREQPLIQD